MQKDSLAHETEWITPGASTVTGADQAEPLKIVACVVLTATQKVALAHDNETGFRPALGVATQDAPS